MKQLLSVLALASFAVACGDDDTTTPTVHADAGVHDAATSNPDSGAVTAKVSNVGVTCGSASDCGGTAAICETKSFTGAADPGGQCSAVCTVDTECGAKGVCPAGHAIDLFGKIYPAAVAALGTEGHCSQSCTLTDSTTCRTGYTCVTLNALAKLSGTTVVSGVMGTEFLDQPFCAPLPALDGGVPAADAGATAKVIGMDSGL